jgi:peptidoglycan/LPS O-acetylase OafA/YrhL
MVLSTVTRRIVLVCTVLFLIVLAWAAILGGLRQLPRSVTTGQRVETVVQLACGALSLLVVFTCFRLTRWAARVRTAWAASLVVVAGLSSLVWGPPMFLTGLVFAVTALIVALIVIHALRSALDG